MRLNAVEKIVDQRERFIAHRELKLAAENCNTQYEMFLKCMKNYSISRSHTKWYFNCKSQR
ncbi:CLUMA_CG004190, isoform A [Clunio marinus]|uniref:CLUMA_CG004190, isoform A n=1 Tax=Clunio marinus TaxID=568069 RepID=A0A1J1HWB5_9DIPT|nr:CLUMA_CG004190, isoform A [Clunio marinus]